MSRSLIWKLALFTVLLAACTSATPADIEEVSVVPTVTKNASATLETNGVIPEADVTTNDVTDSPLLDIQAIEELDLSAVPDVDTSQHNIPLDEIIFDTFQPVNRAVPLTKAQPALIRSLRDAIPPIYEPLFDSSDDTDGWLSESDIVLGYADGEEAYAYPIKILNFHEMISHQVNGHEILASYCPLCRSGIVYDRTLPGSGAALVMGNTSALYESDMVMFDHQTGTYWNQVSGEAIVGPLTGQRLSILPAQMTTWGEWKQLYPDTLALSENTGFERNYLRDPFAGYGDGLNAGSRFFFPVSEAGRDPRLDPGEIVLGLEVAGQSRAYPLSLLGDGVLEDQLGETAVVIFSRADGPSGAAYLPAVAGRDLSFVFEDGKIRDVDTGSSWDLAGRALSGELAGAQLEPLPARSTFWFSLVANFPEIEVYSFGG